MHVPVREAAPAFWALLRWRGKKGSCWKPAVSTRRSQKRVDTQRGDPCQAAGVREAGKRTRVRGGKKNPYDGHLRNNDAILELGLLCLQLVPLRTSSVHLSEWTSVSSSLQWVHDSICLIGLLWRLNEFIQAQHLVQFLDYRETPVSVSFIINYYYYSNKQKTCTGPPNMDNTWLPELNSSPSELWYDT